LKRLREFWSRIESRPTWPSGLLRAGKLAKVGVDTREAYLGHRNIQHSVRYTELAPDRFKDFWRD
jgi:hypothetical protein